MILWAIRTVLGARRHGLLRLRKVRGPVRLDCLGKACGRCCDLLGGAEVQASEAEPLRTLDAIQNVPTGLRLKCIGTRCILLRDNLCAAYGIRPRACTEYPWYNVNGMLYYDAGCPGIRHDIDGHPQAATLVPASNYFTMFPRPLRPLALRLLTLW